MRDKDSGSWFIPHPSALHKKRRRIAVLQTESTMSILPETYK